MCQEFAVAQPEEGVELGGPWAHRRGLAAPRLELSKIEVGRDNEVERLNFLMGQIVLGETDIGTSFGVRGSGFRELRFCLQGRAGASGRGSWESGCRGICLTESVVEGIKDS